MKKAYLALAAMIILSGCGSNKAPLDLNINDEVIYTIDDTEVSEQNETILYTRIHNDYFDFAMADITSGFESCESDYTDFEESTNMHYVTLYCKGGK